MLSDWLKKVIVEKKDNDKIDLICSNPIGGTMTKEEIAEVFKVEGLDVAEDMAVAACRAVFKLIRIFVPKVSFGLGAIIGPIVDLVEPQILAMLDKIDGEDDPEY